MHPVLLHSCRLLLAAALLGSIATSLRADDDDDDLVDDRAQAVRNQVRFAGGRVNISERNIDGWIYGAEGRSSGWLEMSLKQKVAEVAATCGLSGAQREKLALAGKGDIRRFETRVEELKGSMQLGQMRVEKYSELFQKTRPLNAQLQRGLFETDSLFRKTLVSTLSAEQFPRYEQLQLERRAWRYRARVEMCVAQLDAILGLRDDQRHKLVDLVLKKCRPPKSFGQSERMLVLVQMSRLPEEDFKSILDDVQWPEMHRRLTNARRMMPVLKQQGVILDEDEQPAKGAEAGLRVH